MPMVFEGSFFLIRPITIDDNENDYFAVMDNLDGNGNPKYPNHTLKQNLIDLGYHQKEMQKKASFTYSIRDSDDRTCIGCLYIYPCDNSDYDVEISFWLRSSYVNTLNRFTQEIQTWIASVWPFKNVKYA